LPRSQIPSPSPTTSGIMKLQMSRRRVAITGCGAVSGYGVGTELFLDAIFAGQSCVRKISWDASMLGCRIGAEMDPYDATPYFREPKDARRFEPTILHAVAAARLALDQAKLAIGPELAERTAVYIG